MRKIFSVAKNIIKSFFINSFWKSWKVLAIIFLSLAINGILWYIYLLKLRQNPIPFIFSSGLIGLNLILGNFLWNRQPLASYFLLFTGLLVQVLMAVFIRYMMMVF